MNLVDKSTEQEVSVQQKQVQSLQFQAETMKIVGQTTYEQAIAFVREIEKTQKVIEEKRKSITKPLDDAKKAVQSLFMPIINACGEISMSVRGKIQTYEYEREKARQEEQAKLEAKAREEERKKKEAIDKKIAEELSKGNAEKAKMLEEKKDNICIQAPIVATKIQKPAGVSSMQVWKYKVTDEFLVPREYLIVNDELLSKLARSAHDSIKIKGIEFYSESVPVIRR